MMSEKKTILDVFSQISSEAEATKPDLCIRLWNHLNSTLQDVEENSEEENVPKEVTYTLRRLIQGLGSSRAIIRKSYFATLVSILLKWNSSSCKITLDYYKSIVDKQLTKFESKGEEGEILTGRILAYGVAIRSKIIFEGDVELQREILAEMLIKSKERSYLPLIAYTFITDFLNSTDEKIFETIIWPVLKNEIIVSWPAQSFETLHCLLQVQNKYPNALKKKRISTCSFIVNDESINDLQKLLTNITWEPRLKHPLYDSIGRYLCQNKETIELRIKFCELVENVLKENPTRLQQLAVLKIFSSIVDYIDFDQIHPLLTPIFVDHIINSCRSTGKKDRLSISGKNVLQSIVARITNCTEPSAPSSVYKILCRLTFDSGNLLVEKVAGVKLISLCLSKLDGKHLKLLAKKCETVILLRQNQKTKKNVIDHRWNFKERSYAAQLLARLISHVESQEMDWKIKHLKFMMKYALFLPNDENEAQISQEFANVLKSSFFTALSHQLSHLENHRMVLISLVYHIDNILINNEGQLRTPLSQEEMACWKETMKQIQKIDLKINKTEKRKTVMYIFHTLFLQMTLHLFVDSTMAKDILGELNRCYQKQKSQLKMLKETKSPNLDSESMWIEVAVELILSLLSRDTYLLRQLISRIFPHLCPFLNEQAAFQILQVFDTTSNNSILIDENEESYEEGSSDEESGEGENEANGDGAAETDDINDESDSDVEDIDDVEESAIEKTRQAVRDALGIAGSVTDTESIDLDDIDDDEGRRLDVALSDAFKNVKKPQNKTKKQSPAEKALTNFRIRVLDLIDIYLESSPSYNPSLALVLDTIPTLFSMLEFCIKDSHQKPLENRLRSTLKKIGNLKKCSCLEEVNEQLIVDVLKMLMEKGDRSSLIFLDLCHEITECVTFLVRMSVQVAEKEECTVSSLLYELFINAVDNFFLKRDCLLPVSLFENILMKTNWRFNTKLCERIVTRAFDSAVRGFRRNQGLSLLRSFYKNTRLLSSLKEYKKADTVELEDKIIENSIRMIYQLKNDAESKIKPSFVSELFALLYAVKISKFSSTTSKWNELIKVLQSFVNNGYSTTNISKKYVTKLCSLLRINVASKSSNVTRKRKLKNEDSKPQVNGVIPEKLAESEDELNVETNNCDTVTDAEKTNIIVIKKKKSKRKSKEHIESKKRRRELTNEIDVMKFSTANISDT